MRKQAFVLAAGEQKRFPKDSPPKQLLRVGGEPIILRMVRQVRQRKAPAIVVTLNDAIVNAVEVPVWFPDDNTTVLNTMMSTREAWRGQTIVLLGDVIYSKAAMDEVMAFEGRLRVFGRQGEIFAVSFEHAAADEMCRLAQQAIDYWLPHGPDKVKVGGLFRAAVRADQSIPIQSVPKTKAYSLVDDYTNDVDSRFQYGEFIENVVRAGMLDDRPGEEA